MIEIVPAVLPKSFAELEEGLARLRGVATAVQVDVVQDIFAGKEAMPHWEDFDFEFDLFIEPAPFIETALALGASRVIVHARHKSARQALESLQKTREGEFSVAVGLGLRSSDEPDVLDAFAGLYDFVQVMGILHEGVQGEPYDPRAAGLVRALRAARPELPLQVDGHAAGHEIELVEAGATRLIVGSAIVGADDPKAAYKRLYTLVNGS